MTFSQIRPLALLAFGYLVSVGVASGVLGTYTGWEGEALVGRYLTMFLMPIAGTTIYLLVGSLQRRHAPANGDPLGHRAVEGIVFWILMFLIGVHVVMMAVLTGVHVAMPWAQRSVIVMLGITLIGIGNLLPRTRPNFAVGIRTARTLTDRQLWIATHRVSGYILVSIGIVTVVSGLLVSGTAVAAAPLIGGLAGVALIGVYYWRASATRAAG